MFFAMKLTKSQELHSMSDGIFLQSCGQVEKEVDTEPLGVFDQVAESWKSNLPGFVERRTGEHLIVTVIAENLK